MDKSTRKEKVTKSQAKRARKQALENPVVENKALSTPATPVEQLNKAEEIKSRRLDLPTVDMTIPNQVNSTKSNADIIAPSVSTPLTKGSLETSGVLPTGATAQKQATIINKGEKPYKEAVVLSPWEQMLADRRETLKQDKTDAAKMQKYYALSDALKAIGKMGGTAIGSTIGGGKAIDNASPVGEYKASRGYLDAFEKAKNANEKLRALDEYELKLDYAERQKADERAYNEKQKADERSYQKEVKTDERAYNDKVRAEDKAWKETQAALDRKQKEEAAKLDADWHYKLATLKSELDKAGREDAARIKRELAEEERNYKNEQMKLKFAYEIKKLYAKGYLEQNDSITEKQLNEFLSSLDSKIMGTNNGAEAQGFGNFQFPYYDYWMNGGVDEDDFDISIFEEK